MTARAHINKDTKLAATLLALGDIPHDDAKLMSADQIISLYHFDHGELHAFTKNNHFSNLTPRLITPHRRKSRTDTGIVAKVRRLTKEQEAFQRKVLARPCGEKRQRTGNWPSRKMRGRGFPKRRRG